MVWRWSKIAANNANADSTINWAEGQPPSSINDSSRAEMARVAQYRDDISGAILTTGTSSAYTVGSNQVFDTLAHMDGGVVAFTPHTGNASPCTLNVDSLGAKPLRLSPGVEIPAGTLVQGTPYVALYNNANAEFYLRGFLNLPYSVPVGGFMPFVSTTLPNSNFVLPYGQALSRTTYAALFTLVGTTFGSGDGSTTFNVPDLRGRVPVAQDNMGGVAAGRITSAASGVDGTTIGSTGGIQSKTLAVGEMPQHNHTTNETPHSHGLTIATGSTNSGGGMAAAAGTFVQNYNITTASATTGISINNSGSSAAFSFLQPSIVLPYILRVI